MSGPPPAPYVIEDHANLGPFNTLRVATRARRLAVLHDAGALPQLLEELGDAPLVLGSGSNVLFVNDYPGCALVMAPLGVDAATGPDWVRLTVAAGERWDDLVRWSLGQGYPGLENLILIPGTVGAAPIQNIGAYGVEVSEFVIGVETFDTHEHRVAHFNNAACQFSYRDSIFKREPDRYIVTSVQFELPRQRPLRIDYAGIQQQLERSGIAQPTPYLVADAVRTLRERKLPDPAVIGNAGSFFKNPMVPASMAADLARDNPELPQWPAGEDQVKLSAAWLIEACGYKGLREGDAGISPRHALVLVNHGQASGADLWALACKVAAGVKARFDIDLVPEPRIIGA